MDYPDSSNASANRARPHLRETEYRDILVRVGKSNGAYEVSLHHFPLPAESDPASVAVSAVPLNKMAMDTLERCVKELRSPKDQPGLPKLDQTQKTGRLLRRFLFPSQIWQPFCELFERHEKQGYLVRIRLLVEDEHLRSWPWETIFIDDDKWRCFLAEDSLVSITRLINTETPQVPLAPMEQLRVLLIGCSLGDSGLGISPLPKTLMELQAIENGLEPLRDEGLVYSETLVNPTVPEIEEKFTEAWHVVCYSGHGVVLPDQGAGCLILNNGTGEAVRWALTDLAHRIRRSDATRLVVLNCCELGHAASATLINAGVSAVVGIQFVVSDAGSTRGAEAMFRALANRLPIDEAVYRYRQQAGQVYLDYAEQCSPVLYLQASDGKLFAKPDRVALGKYLRFLCDRHSLLASFNTEKPLRMGDFYVTLRLGKEVEKKPEGERSSGDRKDVLKDFRVWRERAEAAVKKLEPIAVEQVLKTRKRIVVMGDPGAGKSTLIRHTCFTRSKGLLSSGLPKSARSIPIFVKLSDLAEEYQAGKPTQLHQKNPLWFGAAGSRGKRAFKAMD